MKRTTGFAARCAAGVSCTPCTASSCADFAAFCAMGIAAAVSIFVMLQDAAILLSVLAAVLVLVVVRLCGIQLVRIFTAKAKGQNSRGLAQ